ncbi:hypothetical protein RhiirA4_479529 [Rhizophagus irregularis]|uniref:Uncharacterized protein n=1 Tax=Rhizophagus irregularis TaxID=588596 RepID=A0A2I1HGL2_9GLOM|nr:hypothetical protein RhiirA4_479529 [Rhizophagus irregularis]
MQESETSNISNCQQDNNILLQKSIRLLVIDKLYPLCFITEYRDMLINKINKFYKKNQSFSETVSDWADHKMIHLYVNYEYNDYEDIETSGQECKAIETDNNVSSIEKSKKAIKNTTSITKRSSHRAKVKQLNNNNIEAIATIGQKHKAKEFNKDSSLAIR